MNIFDYYNAKNEDQNWVEEYQSTSDKKSGKTFLYTNTNFRTIYAFADVYNKFLEYNNLSRNKWATYQNGEQMAKHWTVRMQQSQFFKKSNGKYVCTEKGKTFGKLIEIEENEGLQNENDFWILTYYLILNSYFGFSKNYIIKRTQEFYLGLHDAGYSAIEINGAFENILSKKDTITIDQLFEEDGFWMLSFFKDKDFMNFYKSSSFNNKKLLFSKVQAERKKTNSVDLIGHKFVNSGQYNASMVIDDICVLYVTHEMLTKENNNALNLLDNICSIVERFGNVDRKFLSKFLQDNFSIFDTIFNEAILDEDIDDEINQEEAEEENENVQQIKNVDTTTTESKQLLRSTRSVLKRMAKSRSGYKCELEYLNSCKYFTSKEDNKNYLEIHHLIPWAFSNEFENSLEHIDNYVALCPHCHMLLHHGTDRERKNALTFLYNNRKEKLIKAGLEISLEDLFKFYEITE